MAHGQGVAPTRKSALLPLMLTPVLSGLAMTGPMPILPAMSRHFASTPDAGTLVRMMTTSVGAAVIFGAPLAALLSERFGERKVLMGALALFALFGTAGSVIDNLYILVATRILLGLTLAATGVMALTLLTKLVSERERNRWLGYSSLVGALGTMLLMPIAAYLGSIDWRLMFLLHLIALPMLFLLVVLTPEPAPDVAAGDLLLTKPRSRFPMLMLILGLACGVPATASVYVPFHLIAIGETDPNRIALPITASIITTSLVAFGYGWLRSYLNAVQVFASAFAIVAVALLAIANSHSMEIAAVCMLLSGVGTGAMAPTLFAIAAGGDPLRRAHRFGYARAGYYGAPLLAQLALEPLVIAFGASAALLAIAGFSLAIAVVMVGARRRIIAA